MIFLFAVISLLSIAFLPWWMLIITSFAYGVIGKVRWTPAFFFAVTIAVNCGLLAYYFNQQSHGIITERIAGVLGSPEFVIVLIPVFINFWLALFFARMGGSIRALLKK